MQKIIFLDFDGVLNTEYYQGLLQFQGKQWQELWRVRNLPGKVIDITPSLTGNASKGEEIAAWLSNHTTQA